MSDKGRTINIFLSDENDPEGISFANLCATRVVTFRRSGLSQFKEISPDISNFPGIDRQGVYILIGEDEEEAGCFQAYVGESGDVFKRLCEHDRGSSKSFWKDTVVLVSRYDSGGLATGARLYAEAALIGAITGNYCWSLPLNRQRRTTDAVPLSYVVRHETDKFIDQAKVLVGMLGWDMFRKTDVGSGDVFLLEGDGYDAKMEVVSSFRVKAGSKARGEKVGSILDKAERDRDELLKGEILEQKGEFLVFKKNYNFPSSSAAAAVVTGGGTTNGKTAWKLPNGQTLSKWESSEEERQENESEVCPLFSLKQKGLCDAKMEVVSSFRVKAGSKAREGKVGSILDKVERDRDELLKGEILKQKGEFLVFKKSYNFPSSSAAAAVVTGGGTTNGKTAWKLPNGQTLGKWESSE